MPDKNGSDGRVHERGNGQPNDNRDFELKKRTLSIRGDQRTTTIHNHTDLLELEPLRHNANSYRGRDTAHYTTSDQHRREDGYEG